MMKMAFLTAGLLLLAVLLGSFTGLTFGHVELLNSVIDYLILALVFLVFVDVPLANVTSAVKQPKVLLCAWLTNFMLLPVLGILLTKLFLPNHSLVAVGLAVYFLSPCTDWFLGFTRLAKGNTALGSVMLPINMVTQLILYPFWLQWISQDTVIAVSFTDIVHTLFDWFVLPVVFALIVKGLTQKRFQGVRVALSECVNWILYALTFVIFAVNVQQIIDNSALFGVILFTVMVFFVISGVITEIVAKRLKFSYEDHVLYTMTTTARNAPLMLGLTMTALPDQPLVYAALIIGMLIEFPYLALQVLRFNASLVKGEKLTSRVNASLSQ